METLNRSRRSSVSSVPESDISEMENEIILKSGIELSKNSNDRQAPAPISSAPKANRVSNEAKFVSGTEEDLNVVDEPAQDDAQEEMEELEQNNFDDTLERRDDYKEENDDDSGDDDSDEDEKLASLDSLVGGASENAPTEAPAAEASQEEAQEEEKKDVPVETEEDPKQEETPTETAEPEE